ncbi:tetratricopeptide repeat protein [Flavobacteriaceae bacterium TK19130]|nr:tetratricopeptide repeat protein [Thermobacterium salinum]
MATYKKRGYKPKTKEEKQEALEEQSTTAEVFGSLDEGASRTEQWLEKNQKAILGVVGVIAIAVLGYLAYQQFVQKPTEEEAMNELYKAQSYYDMALTAEAKDSLYGLALNGGEGKFGFLGIIDSYGSTDAANIANYYAGISYLNTNRYQEAINHLDDFDGSDTMLAPIAKGAIGDAFVQLDQPGEALKYYEEAAKLAANDLTAPRYLLKAGITAMKLEQYDKALAHFQTIEDEYSTSEEANQAQLYVGQVEAMQ